MFENNHITIAVVHRKFDVRYLKLPMTYVVVFAVQINFIQLPLKPE